MLKDNISNPDHWQHDVYQRRINRWTILIEIILILLFIFLNIEVPDTANGHVVAFKLSVMVGGLLATLAGAFAGSIVFLVVYGIYQWLKGK